MPASKRNGILVRIAGVLVAVALLAILGLSFTNQAAMAKHNSANGPHGKIVEDLATIKTNIEWLRKHLDIPPQPEADR